MIAGSTTQLIEGKHLLRPHPLSPNCAARRRPLVSRAPPPQPQTATFGSVLVEQSLCASLVRQSLVPSLLHHIDQRLPADQLSLGPCNHFLRAILSTLLHQLSLGRLRSDSAREVGIVDSTTT